MPSGKSEIKVTASDALEFERVETKVGKLRRRVRALLVVVVLVVAGAGVWAVYGDRLVGFVGNSSDKSETPLVRAEITPVKIRPDNPGGLQVPNRDILVYGLMQGAAATNKDMKIERLLAEPEKPLLAPTESIVMTIEEVPNLADVRQTPPVQAPPVELGTAREAKAPLQLRKSSAPIRLNKNIGSTATAEVNRLESIVPKPTGSPKTVAKLVPPKLPPIAVQISKSLGAKTLRKARTGVHRVQLAAARTEELAQTEWNRVRRRNLDLLGDLVLTIIKADLGTKGVFFRVWVGPLTDETQARALCSALGKRKIGCLVIKPDRL